MIRSRWRGAGAVVLALACAAPAAAQQTRAAGDIPHQTYRLANGLHVILAPDPSATAVAVNLWYDVGSRHERPGRSGFGHLFEHLMFQGSENVERGAHFQFVERAGGSLNASITEDRTNYFQTVPAERYNLALWLESDRMRSLRVTEENFRREVEVVKEERRLRIDNAPYGTSQLAAFYYAPYDAATCFAYGHSVIGSMDDLEAAELRDVQEFFDTYYAPNNATLVLAGAFDPAEARVLIEQYFGDIPAAAPPPPVVCEEPFRGLPSRLVIEDGNARLPAFRASYGGVAAGHADSYALSLLGSILGQGQTARLHERLVRQEGAALGAGAGVNLRRGPGLFVVQATANQGVDVDRVQRLVDEEIARIQREGVTAEELERAKSRYRANAVFGRQSVMGRAEALQWHNHFLGSPGAIRTEMERYMAVTAADVQRVAAQYLTPQNRAVIITQPATAATE
jgi:zinc protease